VAWRPNHPQEKKALLVKSILYDRKTFPCLVHPVTTMQPSITIQGQNREDVVTFVRSRPAAQVASRVVEQVTQINSFGKRLTSSVGTTAANGTNAKPGGTQHFFSFPAGNVHANPEVGLGCCANATAIRCDVSPVYDYCRGPEELHLADGWR